MPRSGCTALHEGNLNWIKTFCPMMWDMSWKRVLSSTIMFLSRDILIFTFVFLIIFQLQILSPWLISYVVGKKLVQPAGNIAGTVSDNLIKLGSCQLVPIPFFNLENLIKLKISNILKSARFWEFVFTISFTICIYHCHIVSDS